MQTGDVDGVLHEAFGHRSVRPGQRQAIEGFLAGRDVQVLLPTGGGKSLCYQLPAVILSRSGQGPTLVVSPLVALMDDQVGALRARGIAASALHRGTPSAARTATMKGLSSLSLLYVSPERIAQDRFRRTLRDAGLARIAIDEAHCISEWGHDFRPDYLTLGVLKEELGVPTMALTATATPKVMDEIGRSLKLVDPDVIRSPFTRENLVLSVEHHKGDNPRTTRLVALLGEAGLGVDPAAGRVVVYVATRARTKAVATVLSKAGFGAAFYHAGRTGGARTKAQDGFAAGKQPVMVATTAFGMGIDQPDVRLVVHVQAPGSLEAYAQQAGRAGRDGRAARCVLMYSPGDARTQGRLRGDRPFPGAVEGWRSLQDYVFGTSCRMAVLARHFGDSAAPGCGTCDVCTSGEGVAATVVRARAERDTALRERVTKRKKDEAVVLDDAARAQVVAFVDGLVKPVGKRLVAAGLRGGRSKRALRLKLPDNPAFGALRGTPEIAILTALDTLLADGTLVAKGKKYPTVWIPEKRVRPIRDPNRPKPEGPTGLRAALRDLRKNEARRRRWKPYQVFPNKTLDAIVATRPTTVAELLELPGLGPARIEKFSDVILTVVRRFPSGP